MSQNLRVALWVPQNNPTAVGDNIRTLAPPTANRRVPSAFAVGNTLEFAEQGEVTGGAVGNEVISPLTLRNDNARLMNIPSAAFLTPIALQASAGAASANKVVKTAASGLIDDTFISLDGGTF